MTEVKPVAVAQPATWWQRISFTAAAFVGCYVAWAMYEYLLSQWVPTYATVNAQYQERLKATQVAIGDLKLVQDSMPGIQVKALTGLQTDLDSIGEAYRESLAKLPDQQVSLAKGVLTAAGITGVIASVLTAMIGWTLEGLGALMRRRDSLTTEAPLAPLERNPQPIQESRPALAHSESQQSSASRAPLHEPQREFHP